jgi:hypothetical protein
VRSWYKTESGEPKPSRAGITLAVRHLPALAQALATALVRAREMGLIADHGVGK